MAVDPDMPFNREEMYLAAAAGEGVEVPPCPWSRKEAYLADIGGRLDDMDTRIAALATDISFKGSVATENDLPSGAAVGDAYITEDTGVIYVWVGDSWVALGGTGINVVQTTGTSTTDVMSQNAVSSTVFADPGVDTIVKIGAGINTGLGTNNIMIGQNVHTAAGTARSNAIVIGGSPTYNEAAYVGADKSIAIGYTAYGGGNSAISIGTNSLASNSGSIAIGQNSYSSAAHTIAIGGSEFSNEYTRATQQNAIAIGINARAAQRFSVALGSYSEVTRQGEVNIGETTGHGYNSTNYRVLGGVHDPVDAHDAATKGYVDLHAGATTFYIDYNDSPQPGSSEINKSLYLDTAKTVFATGEDFRAALETGMVKIGLLPAPGPSFVIEQATLVNAFVCTQSELSQGLESVTAMFNGISGGDDFIVTVSTDASGNFELINELL